jgi:hypothetical protein
LTQKKHQSVHDGYKRNNETAYLTSVAYVKTQDKEAAAIQLKEKSWTTRQHMSSVFTLQRRDGEKCSVG